MKFSTAILTLFAAASAIAVPLTGFENCKSQVFSINSACTAEVGEDREQACIESLSQKCQAFFNNPLAVDDECQNITGDEKAYLLEYVKEKHADNNLYCHKMENGEYCPFGDVLVTTKQITEDDFNNAIFATCQYKECVNLTVQSIKTTLQNTKYQSASSEVYLNWYKNGLAYLEDDVCLSKSV